MNKLCKQNKKVSFGYSDYDIKNVSDLPTVFEPNIWKLQGTVSQKIQQGVPLEFWVLIEFYFASFYGFYKKKLSIFCIDFDDMMMRWITSILFYSFFVSFAVRSSDWCCRFFNFFNQGWCYFSFKRAKSNIML